MKKTLLIVTAFLFLFVFELIGEYLFKFVEPRFIHAAMLDSGIMRSVMNALLLLWMSLPFIYAWLYVDSVRCKQKKHAERELAVSLDQESEERDRRKESENALKYMTYYDTLTGLPNRRMFQEMLMSRLLSTDRESERIAVVFLDIDRFKFVNDTYGYAFGDRILQMIAEKLKSVVGRSELIARMGGDEFMILLVESDKMDSIPRIVNQVIESFQLPIVLNGDEFHLKPSIGVAFYPCNGEDSDTLMKHADVAMYRAKARGGNQFRVFTSALGESLHALVTLDQQLRKALERGEFILYYQPKIDLRTMKLSGFEALIRWERPEIGIVSPTEFIPFAEETGMIVPIGLWVLRTACRQNMEWQQQGFPPLRVAVNVSARQFQQSDLSDQIGGILRETGLEPEWLEIEITESAVMQNAMEIEETIQNLKQMGVHITIDDFGTGYSSLGYLKRFQLHSLKIDKSFVQDVIVDPEDALIVSAVINLAHNLGINVIAEGVESVEQMIFLREQGCDQVQGYLFLQPVPANRFQQFHMSYRNDQTLHGGAEYQWMYR